MIATTIANIGSGMTTLVSIKLDISELSSIAIVDLLSFTVSLNDLKLLLQMYDKVQSSVTIT
jgi:hypothetical protein